jgi:hypothetical protein
MFPALRDGDLVTAAPVRDEDVRPGDVLLYAASRGLTAHRVTRRLPRGSGLVARGDSPGSGVERVAWDQVLGRIESVKRGRRERRVGRRVGLGLRRVLARIIAAVAAISARRRPGSGSGRPGPG